MSNRFRRFIFDNYGWIVVVILCGLVPLTIATSRTENVSMNLATVCGSAIGIVFVIQKQRNEELLQFERLFVAFNARYAALNDNLQAIVHDEPLEDKELRKTLNDYFNLCAEEYLFYREGIILEDVWRSWHQGMSSYLECPRIQVFCESDVRADTHYGLTYQYLRPQVDHIPSTDSAAPPGRVM